MLPKSSFCLSLMFAMLTASANAQDFDIKGFFAKAAESGRAGLAQKTKMVDAKPAEAGEIVVTVIKSEGVETKSKPAESGDMVVRNRCPETGNELYLVKAATFAKRYGTALNDADAQGFKAFRPSGTPMRFITLSASEGPFTFNAPWGESMIAKPGDTIVQDPNNPSDTYRVAAAAFRCTYDVTEQPKAGS